jgi:hypothetical protein
MAIITSHITGTGNTTVVDLDLYSKETNKCLE